MGCSFTQSPDTCTFDVEAVQSADQAYATAWLTNDPDKVMATLTEDPLIMPSGIPALTGTREIREFWWPSDSPPATVMTFDLVQQEVEGRAGLAFVRGSFVLRFEFDGRIHTGIGDYLSLLRCFPDGSWRISHRAWNDLPQPSD